MFFDVFSSLCEKRGISVYKACTENGLNRSIVSKWKDGAIPNGKILLKLADYFGVSVDYLLGKEAQSDHISSPAPSNSEIFFDVFSKLCKTKGISPTRAALDIGLSRATPTTWKKKGITPQAAQLQKIAEYFGVSVDYLLGKESFSPPTYPDFVQRYKKRLEDWNVTSVGYGPSIQLARTKAGLSLQQLAEKAGLSLQQLELYEKNEALPTFDQLKALASALGISLLDIMGLDLPFVQHCILESSEQELSQLINTMIYATSAIKNFEGTIQQVHELYEQLNEDGQQRALENLQDIAEIPKYQKKQDEPENKDGSATD